MPLTRLFASILLAAGSVVLLGCAANAADTPRRLTVEIAAQPTDWSAQRRKRARQAVRAPTQIACTEMGCHPVPPGCTPVAGRTFWGNYSGFDVVACRRR